MAKPEWGSKRTCHGCGVSFYDMRREPVICPKCGEQYDPAAQQKQRPRAEPAVAPAPVKPKVVPAVDDIDADDAPDVVGDDDEVVADDKIVNLDEDSEEEDVIEDPSELGEDKDDMFEVMDNVEEKDD